MLNNQTRTDDPFSGKGLFTSNDPLIALQYADKADWVAIKVGGDDGWGGQNGPKTEDVQKLKNAGFTIILWQDGASEEGIKAIATLGADGYIAQAEGQGQLEAAERLSDQVSVPKALVSNNFMDKYPPGWIAMPEAYQNANPNATVENVVAGAIQRGATRVIPILGTYDATSEGGGIVSSEIYRASLANTKSDNFGIFAVESSSPQDLNHLFDFNVTTAEAPTTKPTPPPIVAPEPRPSRYEHGQGHPPKKPKPAPNIFDKVSPPDVQDRRAEHLLGLRKGDDFQGYGDIEAAKKLKNGGKVYTLESGSQVQVNPDGSYYRLPSSAQKTKAGNGPKLKSLPEDNPVSRPMFPSTPGTVLPPTPPSPPRPPAPVSVNAFNTVVTQPQPQPEPTPSQAQPEPQAAPQPQVNTQPQTQPESSPTPAWHTNPNWKTPDESKVAKAGLTGNQVLEERPGQDGKTVFRLSDGSYQSYNPKTNQTTPGGTWNNDQWNNSHQYAAASKTIETPSLAPSGPTIGGITDPVAPSAGSWQAPPNFGALYGLTDQQVRHITEFINTGSFF